MRPKAGAVIGGCGFIGAHCVARLLREGHPVLCIDNLSRPTARANLRWLNESGEWRPQLLTFVHADIRHYSDFEDALRHYSQVHPLDLVVHEAAQVAVTHSVIAPRNDFEINALGTFNVLEAVRRVCPEATIIFASTNKVYGGLKDIEVCETPTRYAFRDLRHGVAASHPLDFHSPYGCSKGAADQYVRDYARIFDLRTFVFRQSCIYGCRQFGHEDQGWVSWFVLASVLRRPVTIYGNGKQVRDLLWVDDLVEAYWKAWQNGGRGGEIFNIGGGPDNILSLLELLEILKEFQPDLIPPAFADWRPGDQPVYVSDIRDLSEQLNWSPKVSPTDGVLKLWQWVQDNKAEVEQLAHPVIPEVSETARGIAALR